MSVVQTWKNLFICISGMRNVYPLSTAFVHVQENMSHISNKKLVPERGIEPRTY